MTKPKSKPTEAAEWKAFEARIVKAGISQVTKQAADLIRQMRKVRAVPPDSASLEVNTTLEVTK